MSNDHLIPIIEMTGISKRYPGVVALEDVSWTVRKGEVHALVGKNGAGKSTLIKILGGSVQPDAGEIYLSGQKTSLATPHDSIAHKIAIINQELMLIPELSVAENILLGSLPYDRFGRVDWKQANNIAHESISRLGLEINPATPVNTLSVAQQQAVEIAKALSHQADIIVMDEPTSSLASREVENLLRIVRRLSEQGKTIIYITHKLNEVFAVADQITVMRDGKRISTEEIKSTTPANVVNLMVGRNIDTLFEKEESAATNKPALEVRNLTRKGIFENISFTVHSGEIVGLAGLVGAGRTEILRAIFGADPFDSGEVWVEGQFIKQPSAQQMIAAGVALAPEDRKQQGLILGMSILDNINLASLDRMFRNFKKEHSIAQNMFTSMSVRAPSLSTIASTLSGGNQQKIVIAKWLATSPRVILLDEPTRGIDIGAKADIHLLVQRLARQGVGVVLVSSELPELLNVCDRIIVLHDGHTVAEFHYGEVDEETLVSYATGSGKEPAPLASANV
jgi:ABC-type sugar transport system ATPase subunit